jgi:hypothetical protein
MSAEEETSAAHAGTFAVFTEDGSSGEPAAALAGELADETSDEAAAEPSYSAEDDIAECAAGDAARATDYEKDVSAHDTVSVIATVTSAVRSASEQALLA